jgi:hypothetical protein
VLLLWFSEELLLVQPMELFTCVENDINRQLADLQFTGDKVKVFAPLNSNLFLAECRPGLVDAWVLRHHECGGLLHFW